MKRIRFFLLTLAVAMLASCGTMNTVPITGRKQNLLVNDEQVLSLSNQQYQEYMQKARLSADGVNTAMVRRVGQRLADAVVTYLNSNGMGGDVSQYKWEFNLVQDSNVNAFCMPGGKIVVYDGLLPVTRDGASLASTRLQQIGSTVFGLGSTLGSAAYSRKQESEADRLGIIFAAMAGYDPQVAIPFWQRMASATGGGSSIFSDHPSDAKRISDIQKWMPEALKYYKGGGTVPQGGVPLRQSNIPTIHISTKK